MHSMVGRIAAVAAFVIVVGPLGVAGAARGGRVDLREPGDATGAAGIGKCHRGCSLACAEPSRGRGATE